MNMSRKGIRLAGIVLSWVVVVTVAAEPAWGLATEDVGNAPLNEGNYSEWNNTGIMAVVNHRSRVYHTWVNGNEHFTYRGNAKALNSILREFAAIRVDVREVVLRPGPAHATTFEDVRMPCDWQVHLLTGRAGHDTLPGGEIELGEVNPTLTVFVGSGNFKLEEIKIPQGVSVVYPDALRRR